jgi:hypothetical protein
MSAHSYSGRYAKSVFFEQFNDIDVYIEDTAVGSKKLYSVLLMRALGGRINIDSVFPLGNRQAVLSRCMADAATPQSSRRRVYIVDGDFDCVLKRLASGAHPRLFVLNRYCIENYLVDGSSALDVLFEDDADRAMSVLETELAFDVWINRNAESLWKLFLTFAIANLLVPHVPTISRQLRSFVSSADGYLDQAKVDQCVAQIATYIDAELGKGAFSGTCLTYVGRLGTTFSAQVMRIVSGKHFLLPLLLMRMRSITRIHSPAHALKLRLAHTCDVSELEAIALYIAA